MVKINRNHYDLANLPNFFAWVFHLYSQAYIQLGQPKNVIEMYSEQPEILQKPRHKLNYLLALAQLNEFSNIEHLISREEILNIRATFLFEVAMSFYRTDNLEYTEKFALDYFEFIDKQGDIIDMELPVGAISVYSSKFPIILQYALGNFQIVKQMISEIPVPQKGEIDWILLSLSSEANLNNPDKKVIDEYIEQIKINCVEVGRPHEYPRNIISYALGIVHTQLGDYERALAYLKESRKKRVPFRAALTFEGDYLLKPIYNYPSFQEFVTPGDCSKYIK